MRIRCAMLCVCLGWPLAGRGEEASTNLAVQRDDGAGRCIQPAGDATNITEYLQGKFRIPAPPGSNDLATADGRIYRNVQVWKSEPDGLTLRHDEGLAKLEFPQLPEDWRQKYEYDPEAAADYRRTVAAAVQEAERNQQALREQIAAERAKPIPEEPR